MYYKFYDGFINFLDNISDLNPSKIIACVIFGCICIFIRNMIIYLTNK